VCGVSFFVDHALSCAWGGFLFVHHNKICDFIIIGEDFTYCSAVVDDGARLNITARGFWGIFYHRAYFDVRVFNPYAPCF